MPRSLLNSASSSSQISRILASVFGSMRSPVRPGRATSNRSSWRRIFSMKAKPFSYVIGRFVWANAMTLDVVMNTSLESGFRMSIVPPPMMAKRIASAKRIVTVLESRRAQGCGIWVAVLWHAGHVHGWCAVRFFTTTSRNSSCVAFDLWLCKGDLSIRLFSSTGCGSSCSVSTTFSASKGRF